LLQECERLKLIPELICATVEWIQQHQQLSRSAKIQTVSPEVLGAMASTETPDGVVAILPMPADLAAPFQLNLQTPPLVLALDRVQDPGNLGTLLRTALAAGVDHVWLAGGADPWQPKVLRASAGAALQLELRRATSLNAGLELAHGAGVQVFAAVQKGGQPYWELNWQLPSLLLLGNEGSGLTPELGQRAHLITVPHGEEVESLNVAVAAGLMLLERNRQIQVAIKASSGPRQGRIITS
jgi:TrmH family RNA methyltransferase